MAREFTNRILDLLSEDMFNKDNLILELVNYLSEDEVKDFVRRQEFFGFEDLGYTPDDADLDDSDYYDDDMDGDHASALASAGYGTDEDYGYYGE